MHPVKGKIEARAQKKPWAAQKFAFHSQKFFPLLTARPPCRAMAKLFFLPVAQAERPQKIDSCPHGVKLPQCAAGLL